MAHVTSPMKILASENFPETKKMHVHIKTIGLQQGSISRALKRILRRVNKDLHDINLRIVPILTHKTDENMTDHLNK